MRTYLTLAAILMLLSCEPGKRREIGHFDETPENLDAVNSPFDDYNSTAPTIEDLSLLNFSSNRNSSGKDFDIVGENMLIVWDKERGSLNITTDRNYNRFDYLASMLDQINTPCNELGPYSTGFSTYVSDTENVWTDLTLFSNDCEGNQDIKFTYNETRNDHGSHSSELKSLHSIAYLNSDSDDLYPTFFGGNVRYAMGDGIDPSKIEKILFCSDREGEFNLYEADLPSLPGNPTFIETLQADAEVEVKKLAISSAKDDKCPFVNGKLLVFSSNRAGGYGGYDLYYSEYKNGAWTEPANFGDQINTEFDEYRPIVLRVYEFDNNLMIFSSNRPGGKGGFDLYHVGIQQSME